MDNRRVGDNRKVGDGRRAGESRLSAGGCQSAFGRQSAGGRQSDEAPRRKAARAGGTGAAVCQNAGALRRESAREGVQAAKAGMGGQAPGMRAAAGAAPGQAKGLHGGAARLWQALQRICRAGAGNVAAAATRAAACPNPGNGAAGAARAVGGGPGRRAPAAGKLARALLCAALALAQIASVPPAPAYAATAPAPAAITGLAVAPADIVLENDRGITTVSFDHATPAAASVPPQPTVPGNLAAYTGRTVKYYLDEYNKGYRGKAPARVFEDPRDPGWTSPTGKFAARGLPSGMIFDVTATNYMSFIEYPPPPETGSVPGNSPESPPSNMIRIYTGTQLKATASGADTIALAWDDVWYNDQRIYGYDLNVYVSGDAERPESTMRFTRAQIEQNQPVRANQATGKLEYTYTVPYPGRVYTFEIIPLMNDVPGVIVPAANARVTVASRILVSVTKLYESADENGKTNITWELRWSNVTAGMVGDGSRRYTAEYSLFKMGGGASLALLQKISNDTSTVVITPKDQTDPANVGATYEIIAKIFENNEEMYVNDYVTITSGPFTLRESETPYTPQAPVLLLESDPMSSLTASVWWNIPKRVSEPQADDLDVTYEIFVLDDPALLDALDASAQPGGGSGDGGEAPPQPNYVVNGLTLAQGTSALSGENGYPYDIRNLSPNKTYYVAVRAVKSFVDIADMTVKQYRSQISYVVLTTPPELPFGQPPAPVTLEIDKESIKPESAEFTVRSMWYEQLAVTDDGFEQWVYAPGYAPPADGILPEGYRLVRYEPGDRILLYYREYDAATMDRDKPDTFTGYRYITATLSSVDANSPVLRLSVGGLQPNTAYIFWAKADRKTVLSFPSKTILATTPPYPNTEIGVPTTPDFDFDFIGDTYVDMLWRKEPDYRYSIQVSRTDSFEGQGVISLRTSTLEIYATGVDFYRASGLSPDTLYYFRIQAEVTSPVTGAVLASAWSDSKPARTKPPLPPATPAGFGIKPIRDAITKSSIYYEWLATPGIQYILEYSQDAQLGDSRELNVGAVTEYNLTGLLSNHRYYARLYALDPATGLRSEPTYILGVRTLRSDDDYDSNVDTTMPLTGEFVKKDAFAIDGVWHIKILGTDADRLSERVMADTMLDYSIDMAKPPSHTQAISLAVEAKVFDSLDGMLENLELRLADKTFVIRPKTLAPDFAGSAARRIANPRYEIVLSLAGNADYKKPSGYSAKTEPTGFDAYVMDGSSAKLPLERFGKGLRVVVPFTGAAWYESGYTGGIYSSAEGAWERLAASVAFDPDTRKGSLTFEHPAPGNFMAADVAARNVFSDSRGSYGSYVAKLGALGFSDAPIGSPFREGDAVAPAEAVEMLFKTMGYAYGDNYMDSAVKAGFVESRDQADLKLEEALAMVARAYEVKTGRKAAAPAAGGSGAAGGDSAAAGGNA
ncbi:MAG: fibronectin type III domain-containing protein, partial [Clostridiales bacterium]|nr:fibronectin type III domain-containing protein [Clostridiales bacterium]